jgi:hypothetical protein
MGLDSQFPHKYRCAIRIFLGGRQQLHSMFSERWNLPKYVTLNCVTLNKSIESTIRHSKKTRKQFEYIRTFSCSVGFKFDCFLFSLIKSLFFLQIEIVLYSVGRLATSVTSVQIPVCTLQLIVNAPVSPSVSRLFLSLFLSFFLSLF